MNTLSTKRKIFTLFLLFCISQTFSQRNPSNTSNYRTGIKVGESYFLGDPLKGFYIYFNQIMFDNRCQYRCQSPGSAQIEVFKYENWGLTNTILLTFNGSDAIDEFVLVNDGIELFARALSFGANPQLSFRAQEEITELQTDNSDFWNYNIKDHQKLDIGQTQIIGHPSDGTFVQFSSIDYDERQNSFGTARVTVNIYKNNRLVKQQQVNISNEMNVVVNENDGLQLVITGLTYTNKENKKLSYRIQRSI